MRKLIVLVALLVTLATEAATAATLCQASKGAGRAYWSWREINGHRCWYVGHRGRDKRTLAWASPTLARPAQAAADHATSDIQSEHVSGGDSFAMRFADLNHPAPFPLVKTAAVVTPAISGVTLPNPPNAIGGSLPSPPPPPPTQANLSGALIALVFGLGALAVGVAIIAMSMRERHDETG